MKSNKNTQAIVRNVLALDAAEASLVGVYHAIGAAFAAGKADGSWSSFRECVRVVSETDGMVVSLARVQRGAAVAAKYPTAKEAEAAFASAKFGTTLGSFLNSCGLAGQTTPTKAVKKASTKVSAKDKAVVAAMATAIADPALRKAILALVK